MPICPRCGKTLSSDQALCYHLNRKYKCNTWICQKCDTLFKTKFDLNIHQLHCLGDRIKEENVCPNGFYYKIINLPMVFLEYDTTSNLITYVNPKSYTILPKLDKVIGQNKCIVKSTFPTLNHICDSNGVACYTFNKLT